MTDTKPNPLRQQSQAALNRGLERAKKSFPENHAVTGGAAACTGFVISGIVGITPEGMIITQGIGQEECESNFTAQDCDAAKTMTPEQRATRDAATKAEAEAFTKDNPGAASFVKSIEEACHIETPPVCTAKDQSQGNCLTQ